MNDYDKPKRDFDWLHQTATEPNRGGCLSFFIGHVVFTNTMILVATLMQLAGGYRVFVIPGGIYYRIYLWSQIGFAVVAIMSAIALWKWKKWGYYSLLTVYAISLFWNMLSGVLYIVPSNIIGMMILYALMHHRKDFLE